MRRVVAAILPMLVASAAHAGSACPGAGDASITVAAVDPRLELRLADGRRLRLVGLDAAARTPDDADLGETSRAALATTIAGKALTALVLSDKPDRWGRLPAMAFRQGDTSPGGLAGLAITSGLARYLPEAAARDCRDTLLANEGEARSTKVGLWHDPYYGVLAVDDRRAFAERSATNVVVEGRLWRVDPGPFRTKLRFAAPGEDRHGLLVAVVLPKVMKRFEGQGVHFEALIGRTLRLRGLLDLRFGPQIEIEGPDAMELVPDASALTTARATTP